MKVLTIKEPFASLIKEGIKTIETRSWKTKYRGEIYIHASISKDNFKNKDKQVRVKKLVSFLKDDSMEYGNIICKCNLIDCIYMNKEYIDRIKDNKIEYLCGHYEEGRYAWVLEIVEVLENPIPAKGRLGIWNYDDKDR
jgi:hypothetical protein